MKEKFQNQWIKMGHEWNRMVKKSSVSGKNAQKESEKSLYLHRGFVDYAMGHGDLDKNFDDFYEK